ncbi:unnamed protein product [Thlaspi arvense]|uniref:RRM domain-containing protein n=1 Tax=Thlaspi arvense TaxID=13288 RepID=A0AAU9RW48_THLAR|nr:unnamed protein product [Thlaspi arvense]
MWLYWRLASQVISNSFYFRILMNAWSSIGDIKICESIGDISLVGLLPSLEFSMEKNSSEKSVARLKAKEFKLFESEAAMYAFMKETSKPRVRISVEGYDTSLPEEDIKKALIDHFASCGEVFNVTFSEGRVGRAFVILRGDGAEEKALQLDGSDVGGWSARVKVTPEETYYDTRFRFGITVRGYDTSVPADELKSTLIKHFSSCGEITHVYISTLDGKADIYFSREDEEEEALKLDETEVGGCKLAVFPVATAARCDLPRDSDHL